MRIHRYPLSFMRPVEVLLHKGAEVVYFDHQSERGLSLWVIEDPEREDENRTFAVLPTTGTDIPENYKYLRTAKIDDFLIYHLFEVTL